MTTAELERPAIDRRHRAALEPVSHGSDDIGALLPTVRRCDDTITDPARRRGPTFHGGDSATAWIVAGGLARLDDGSRRRVADGWRGLHRGHGAGLVVDGGCDVRVGRVPLGAAAREGLLHWLPISRIELALLDGGLFADDPAGAIALLVRPPTIWRLDDARRAELLFPRAPRFEPQRFAAIEEWARREIDTEHLTRLRAAVQRIEAQLPVPDLATASATVAAGCTVIAEDDDRCVAVAARQLARYASSVVLTRQLRDPGRIAADTS